VDYSSRPYVPCWYALASMCSFRVLLTSSSMVDDVHRHFNPGTTSFCQLADPIVEIYRKCRLLWWAKTSFDDRTATRSRAGNPIFLGKFCLASSRSQRNPSYVSDHTETSCIYSTPHTPRSICQNRRVLLLTSTTPVPRCSPLHANRALPTLVSLSVLSHP